MRRLAIGLVALLLVGCVAGRYTERVLESWMGATIGQVVDEWGPPTRVTEVAGRRFYTWADGGAVQLPSTTSTYGTVTGNAFSAQSFTFGGGVVHAWCARTLITDATDSSDRVVSWRWDGNDCH